MTRKTWNRRLTLESLERRDLLAFAAAPMFALTSENASGFVAIEHLNNDSHLDMVVAKESVGFVEVLLGTGNGNFAPAANVATGGASSGVAIGDVNGDGPKDLVLAIGSSATVMLNDGNGGFQASFNWAAGTAARDVAVRDFDNDGDLDIAVAGSTTVNILLNAGGGIFSPHASYQAGANSRSMAVADFDSDSDLDIVVVNYNAGGSVSVIMGQGDGSFGTPKRYRTIGQSPRAVTVGDFNGDSHPDIAASNRGSGTISVHLNKGDGNFKPPTTYAAGPTPHAITSADFNADGHDDLTVTNWESYKGTVGVFLSNPDGTFQPVAPYATARSTRGLAVGDLNGDGTVDIAYNNESTHFKGAIGILRGHGDGTFLAALVHADVAEPRSIASGDFNGDSLPDVVTGDVPFGVRVLLGQGDGTFQQPVTTPFFENMNKLAVGDFDADGFSDVAVVSVAHDHVTVLLSQGDGTFQSQTGYAVGNANTFPTFVIATDLNGDSHVDLAVTNSHYTSGTVSVLLGLGDGTFSPATDYASTAAADCVTAGDFNNDGDVDLVTGHFPPNGGVTVSVLLGNGDGSFQLSNSYDLDGVAISVVAGDYDGDANLDVAVVRVKVGVATLDILSGLGDGSFSAPVHYPIPSFGVNATGGDFNSDGLDDIAVSSGYGFVSIYLAQSNGIFQCPIGYDGIVYYGYLTVSDFNSDSHPDIGVAGGLSSNNSGSVIMLMNDGAWPAPLPVGDGPAADLGRPSSPATPMRAMSAREQFDLNLAMPESTADDAAPIPNNGPRIRPAVRYASVARRDSLSDDFSAETT